MPTHDIIVIGTSAGGVQALRELVGALPAALPAALFVVLHLPADFPSLLPDILTRSGKLPAVHASDGLKIMPGRIYVAPPDHHLTLDGAHMRLSRGPKENFSRPAIDPLFRSAAETYGPRVVGVVLSGTLYDGTAGLIAIQRHGGIGIVQDPAEAAHASMPQSAILWGHPRYILPLAQIAAQLAYLAEEPPSDSTGEITYAWPN